MNLRSNEIQHKDQLGKLARRGTVSVIGAGVSSVSGVALVLFVTRGFTTGTAGVFFSATAAFLMLEAVALLGTETGLVKWLPAHLASGRPEDIRTTLVAAVVPVLLVSLIGAVALFAGASSLAPHMVGSGHQADMTTLLQALAPVLPIAAVYDALLAATRGLGSMRPTVIVDNIGRLGVQAVAVLVVATVDGSVLSLALAWSVPYVSGLAVTVAWLRRALGRRAAAPSAGPRSPVKVRREFWAFTAPRAIARITQTALKRADIVLVAALASPQDAALYTAATRFVVFGQLLVQATQQALNPHLSALFSRGEVQAAGAIFRAATVWSMLAAWPIYLVTAGFAPSLMTLFGAEYSEASTVVVVLSLTMLFATACGPVDSVLLMAGRSWASLVNNSVALLLNVALNLAMIPLYGVTGAAVAWAIAIVVRNVLPLTQVWRGMRLWPGTRGSLYVATGALLCFGVTTGLASMVGATRLTEIIVVLLGTAVYVMGAWWLRGPLGLDAFRSVLRRRASTRTLVGSAAPVESR